MLQNFTSQIIKQVGANGQISLGKEYAGKQIQISKMEDGSLFIQSGLFIPDNERWLHTKENMETLNKAIQWAENNQRRDNFDEIAKRVENDGE
jgi:hypothetical protein